MFTNNKRNIWLFRRSIVLNDNDIRICKHDKNHEHVVDEGFITIDGMLNEKIYFKVYKI